ncbi:hypothetical protein VW29_14705 [Devosia limi DSM 17137]|uniref:HdeA/HdeB family protein n=2 Tax=Devosia TaxID=46913 RepID=A0A0F5LKD3_9HYPH|nr:hypothetical protein VW29_14705 [Devosia limi DSM 17137]SHF48117.1 hypothetical protein SAMN02745223_02743 [Devosia limi DSM 17137]
MPMTARLLATVAAAAAMSFSAPAFAQEEVSDAVDIAMWCGAAFTVAAQADDTPAEQAESSNAVAAILFAKAELALEADAVAETEYDRLVEFYVEDAFAQVINETGDTRYTPEECLALAAEE